MRRREHSLISMTYTNFLEYVYSICEVSSGVTTSYERSEDGGTNGVFSMRSAVFASMLVPVLREGGLVVEEKNKTKLEIEIGDQPYEIRARNLRVRMWINEGFKQCKVRLLVEYPL